MEKVFTELLVLLLYSLVISTISQVVIERVKVFIGLSRIWSIKLVAFAIDVWLAYVVYYHIAANQDPILFITVVLLSVVGAEGLNSMMKSLRSLRDDREHE